MRIVLGLGNPGRRYERTRHNVGFRCVDALAARAGASWQTSKHSALVTRIDAGAPALLVKPTTFMNESGRAASAVANFYQVPLDDLLVVCDDLDLALGRIRLRASGGSGGQNGLKSIAAHLGTQDFARLRIGIGRPKSVGLPAIAGGTSPAPGIAPPRTMDTVDYVLGVFDADEIGPIEAALDRAGDAVTCWLTDGIDAAMGQFNGTDQGKEPAAIASTPAGAPSGRGPESGAP